MYLKSLNKIFEAKEYSAERTLQSAGSFKLYQLPQCDKVFLLTATRLPPLRGGATQSARYRLPCRWCFGIHTFEVWIE